MGTQTPWRGWCLGEGTPAVSPRRAGWQRGPGDAGMMLASGQRATLPDGCGVDMQQAERRRTERGFGWPWFGGDRAFCERTVGCSE